MYAGKKLYLQIKKIYVYPLIISSSDIISLQSLELEWLIGCLKFLIFMIRMKILSLLLLK